MTHIEVSQKIETTKKASLAELKYALTQRIRGAFHVETVGDGEDNFTIVAGRKSEFLGTFIYRFQLNILLKSSTKRACIVVNGNTELTQSTRILYIVLAVLILLFGLFPHPSTLVATGTSFNTIVLLLIGLFVFFDTTRKLAEPQTYLKRILESLDVEFGK